ncbi:SRPBCC family protein [Intrasporangium calvum]
MPTVERSVVIACPVDEAFAYLADPTNGREWRTLEP